MGKFQVRQRPLKAQPVAWDGGFWEGALSQDAQAPASERRAGESTRPSQGVWWPKVASPRRLSPQNQYLPPVHQSSALNVSF